MQGDIGLSNAQIQIGITKPQTAGTKYPGVEASAAAGIGPVSAGPGYNTTDGYAPQTQVGATFNIPTSPVIGLDPTFVSLGAIWPFESVAWPTTAN